MNERDDISTNSTDTNRIIREYFKSDKSDEICKFLPIHKLQKFSERNR